MCTLFGRSRFVALLIGAVCASACAGSDPGDAESDTTYVPPAAETAPEAALASFVGKGGLPAVAVGVIDHDVMLYTGVAGVRKRGDETPVRADDAFLIGSNSKAMTALVAATVVDSGLLTWDATTGDVLGSTIDVGVPYRAVTLTQLLSHESGLPDQLANTDDDSFYPPSAPVADERRRLATLALALAPKSEPGTSFLYSNFNYVVAALMCEVVTGESWEALLRERLFGPLAMLHAGFGPPATPGTIDAPWGHDPRPVDPASLHADFAPAFAPAASVHASVADLLGYARLYLDGGVGPGGRIISDAALTEIETPRLSEYGFGWFIEHNAAGERFMVHNGSNGNFYSTIVLFPDRLGAIVLLTNAGDFSGWGRLPQLQAYLAAHFGLPATDP